LLRCRCDNLFCTGGVNLLTCNAVALVTISAFQTLGETIRKSHNPTKPVIPQTHLSPGGKKKTILSG
jgi:hypothetical protein